MQLRKTATRTPAAAVLLSAAVAVTAIAAARADEPGSQSSAGKARTIPLSAALEVAVRQNPTLELATIDVEVADAQVLESAGLDDWTVGVTATLATQRSTRDDNHRDNDGNLVWDLQQTRTTTGSVQASLQRSLPFGATFGLAARTGYSSFRFDIVNISENEPQYSDSVSLFFTQPLLRGRGEKVARAARKQAHIARDAATLSREAAAITVIRDVILAYWELAYAQRTLTIGRGSLDLASERLRITRAGIDAGSVAPTEALAVEQIIATREQEIAAAEISVSQRSIELRRVAGMEIGPGNIELNAQAPLEPKVAEFDLDALLARAYENSPEIAALSVQEKGASLDVEVTDNGTLPRLDLSLDFGPTGTSKSRVRPFLYMGRLDGYEGTATLTYEHTLGNHAASGSYRKARASLRQARINLADAKAQIAAAMVQAVQSARSAKKRMEISRRIIALAEKNIDAEKTRFELGRSTNFDIMQRQDELKQAQLGYALAAKDYLTSVAYIDALTGDLLGKYGVALDIKP